MIDPLAVAQTLVDFAVDAGQGKVGLIVLCGSHAKGTATASSDLDLYFVPDDNATREAVGRSFVLDGLPYDLWGPGWPFLEAIAHADSPNRPWAVSASLIADTKVLWHRSNEDLDRFSGLKAQIDRLCQPESRAIMISKALAEVPRMVFPIAQMQRAACHGDEAGRHAAGWKLVHRAMNALALVNQTYFHRGWGANHAEILALKRQPRALADRLSGILQPVSAASQIEQAKQLFEDVRTILVEAQATVARPAAAHEILDGVYAFAWEYRSKILGACERGDPLAAAAAAVQLQEELAHLANRVARGFDPADLNLLGDVSGAYVDAGFPDLITPAAAGDLPCLADQVKLLDARFRAWLNAQGIPIGILATKEDLRSFLGRPSL